MKVNDEKTSPVNHCVYDFSLAKNSGCFPSVLVTREKGRKMEMPPLGTVVKEYEF